MTAVNAIMLIWAVAGPLVVLLLAIVRFSQRGRRNSWLTLLTILLVIVSCGNLLLGGRIMSILGGVPESAENVEVFGLIMLINLLTGIGGLIAARVFSRPKVEEHADAEPAIEPVDFDDDDEQEDQAQDNNQQSGSERQ